MSLENWVKNSWLEKRDSDAQEIARLLALADGRLEDYRRAVAGKLSSDVQLGLVGRFICSVTYFLGCFVCRIVELVQHSIEIPSGEAPLERFGGTFVMPLEREQAFC